MLEVITKLLILQDRDQRIMQLQNELAGIGPRRKALESKMASARSTLDAMRSNMQHLESDRKKLELEVEARKLQIERYSLQQFQTKKNEEYRALTHEIDLCKQQIVELDDRQLELMEQIDTGQREVAAKAVETQTAEREIQNHLNDLAAREQALAGQLKELQEGRAPLAEAVEESARARYERLLRHKGERVVVGVDRGVCGGCHMTLPPQILLSCKSDQEIVACPNCGRILFHTPGMMGRGDD